MDDIRNAIAVAVAKAIRNPDAAYMVVEFIPSQFSPSSGLCAVRTNTQNLAPHRVVTPGYRAMINSDNSVSITNV